MSEVVISGIAGKFPRCESIEELKEHLFIGTNLLQSDSNGESIPTDSWKRGKFPNWDKLDYTFFGVPPIMVRNSNPMMGIMLERCYEAIIDAGVNPRDIAGQNVCIFTTYVQNEAGAAAQKSPHEVEGLGMVGASRSMTANRISFCLNLTGPSCFIDGSFTGAVQALEMAAALVSKGLVTAALVSSCSLHFTPAMTNEYKNIGIGHLNEVCSPFDNNADGFTNSDSAASFFIQRAEDAKRNYCSLIKAQAVNLGVRNCAFTKFDSNMQTFLDGFYKNCDLNPEDVSYFEGHGLCQQDIDALELNTIENSFCRKRSSPLPIGSITGNIGVPETTSALVSLIKAIIAFESGYIPPTINYNTPNCKAACLQNGRLKVVAEKTRLEGDVIALNTLSISGSIGHVLARRNQKVKTSISKEGDLPEDGLPRLVCLQARNEEGANAIRVKVNTMPTNIEFIAMTNDVFKTQIPAYLWRAFTVVPAALNPHPNEFVKLVGLMKRPVWFVFSGMGSQWAGMGRDLLQIPVFSQAIDECDKALRPKGLNIKHIITTEDSAIFDNILNSFVGIAAIQIGLVNILRTVGVSPDGMVGHSVGELGCAYADGCFTAQEMILAAYSRGKACLDCDVIPGMMAAVGLGYNEVKDKLPQSIDVACHNSKSSCTLSGPTDDVKKYVDELKRSGVFAKTVSAGGIPYHSRYIKNIGSRLLDYLREVIPVPQPRSFRWISSSVPHSDCSNPETTLSSAEYHTNNLLNPVLFEEACELIPKNVILIEIAPRGLLQAILRRSMGPECINVSLTSHDQNNNIYTLLNAFGLLYLNNINVDVNSLYPPVNYPVPRGTPSLSSLVTWNHEEEGLYKTFRAKNDFELTNESCEILMSIDQNDPANQIWRDHEVYGSIVLPVSQILTNIWHLMSKAKKDIIENCVVFENILIKDPTIPGKAGRFLNLSVLPQSCTFEVCNEITTLRVEDVLLKGKVCKNDGKYSLNAFDFQKESDKVEHISQIEIYSSLLRFNFKVGSEFKRIRNILIGNKECLASVEWSGNVTSFLETCLDFVIFLKSEEKQCLQMPSQILKLLINVPQLKTLSIGSEVKLHYDLKSNRLTSEFLEIQGLTFSPVLRCQPHTLIWKESITHGLEDTNLSEDKLNHKRVFEVQSYDWINNLRQMISTIPNKDHVIVYSKSFKPRELLSILTLEPYAKRIRTVFIMDSDAPQFSLTSSFYSAQIALGHPVNILHNRQWHTLTTLDLHVQPKSKTVNCYFNSSNKKLSVECIALNHTAFSTHSEESTDIKYLDYSGTIEGVRVMGLGRMDAASGTLKPEPLLSWRVPPHWSMEDAATVPAIYSLAYYCIYTKAELLPGQNILLHDGLSPFGRAITAIALQAGGNVYVSVRSDEEVKEITKMFPKLNYRQVLLLNSRDVQVKLMRLTKGKGVEVIVNCTPGELLQSSLKLMGYDCRFIHLGNIRVQDNESIGMSYFFKRTSFYGVFLETVANCDDKNKLKIQLQVQAGIQSGLVKPCKRQVFSMKQETDAALHLCKKQAIEKTILSKMQVSLNPTKEFFQYHPYDLNIIAGTSEELWMDVAEWLVEQGARRLVVLTDVQIAGAYERRFNVLVDRRRCTIALSSLGQLKTKEKAVDYFKNITQMGKVCSIFCVCMDESSEVMKNLDSASRLVLPDLPRFVSLLGQGSAVSEARAYSGLPVYSVRATSALQNPHHVLPHLGTLLAEEGTSSRFFLVNSKVEFHEEEQGDFQLFLPSTVPELCDVSPCVSQDIQFKEVTTLSPRYHFVRRSLLPVFMNPGSGSRGLQPLTAKIMSPVFCSSLPATACSVREQAESLLQYCLRVQKQGPYNILGESWGGAVALELSCLLEERGQEVHLTLLEAALPTLKNRLRTLCEQHGTDLASSLLEAQPNMPVKETSNISQMKSWQEKLDYYLNFVETEQRAEVKRALTLLYNQLSAVENYQGPSTQFSGKLILITNAPVAPQCVCSLSQICKSSPKFISLNLENRWEMISLTKIAAIINDNTVFSWNIYSE